MMVHNSQKGVQNRQREVKRSPRVLSSQRKQSSQRRVQNRQREVKRSQRVLSSQRVQNSQRE